MKVSTVLSPEREASEQNPQLGSSGELALGGLADSNSRVVTADGGLAQNGRVIHVSGQRFLIPEHINSIKCDRYHCNALVKFATTWLFTNQ